MLRRLSAVTCSFLLAATALPAQQPDTNMQEMEGMPGMMGGSGMGGGMMQGRGAPR